MPQEKKYVEVGRVVHINNGSCAGELGAIVDIIDANRLLVDGPRIPRREIKLRNIFLTRIVLKVKKALSHKLLLEAWNRNVVDERFKRTAYSQRLEKMAKRKAMTDFDYFKVRRASRTCNKIVENSYRSLCEKYPRALRKMEHNRRVQMGVKLGYRKLKALTPEKKAAMAARQTILSANRKVRISEALKEKKEKRAKKAEKRKLRIAKKKEAGTLPDRKFVPKEKRVHNKNTTPNTPYVPRVTQFRRERDAAQKAALAQRRKVTQELQANRLAIKKAKEAGTKAPKKIKAVSLKAPMKKSTLRKRYIKAKEAKKAATA